MTRQWTSALLAAAVLAAAGLLTTGVSISRAETGPSWPDFHGPGRGNISTEKGLLKKWPEGGPRLEWTFSQCGEGYAGVNIAQDMLFLAGNFDEKEMILAVGLDGTLVWKSPNGDAWHGPSQGARSTPTYSDGRLFQLSADGRLAALDATSGKELWAISLRTQFDAKPGIWGFAENLIVDGQKVLCMPGGAKGRVVALDVQTGKVLWANTAIEHSAAYCSPLMTTHNGLRQYIGLTQKSVVSVNVESGELLWSHPFVPRTPQNATTPVYHQGHVFVGAGHATGSMLLKLAADSRGATEVWTRKELDSCHGGVLLFDGKVYGAGCRLGTKTFYCLDFFSGEPKQTDKTLSKVAMTCADGMLYCLNHRGRVSLLTLTPGGFDLVSQFDLKKKPDNSYLAHPVVCGGRLYIRCEQDLLAFDIRDRQ